jgi:hypothetical protein
LTDYLVFPLLLLHTEPWQTVSCLTGDAGGVVGYAMTTYQESTKEPVIGFDMVPLDLSPLKMLLELLFR